MEQLLGTLVNNTGSSGGGSTYAHFISSLIFPICIYFHIQTINRTYVYLCAYWCIIRSPTKRRTKMGMYTELVLKCSIKDDIPSDVRAVLRHLFKQDVEPESLPDHAFFKCPRWVMIGQCSSFYHHPKAMSDYWTGHSDKDERGGYLFSRSDLKNYDGEIGHFIDWLMPYIDESEGHCIGWEWYEEDDQPTLLFKKVAA